MYVEFSIYFTYQIIYVHTYLSTILFKTFPSV